MLHPAPTKLTNKINAVEKLDGSCLIVSKYNGELIIRTRRALAENMLNGHEIALFKEKYPDVFNHDMLDEGVTFVFEWTTDTNVIVVRYEEPDIRLIGAIKHYDYSYYTQNSLDGLAAFSLGVTRPRGFQYESLEDMLAKVADLRGEEGVCVYYNNDQHIRKIKGEWYNSVHCFRNAMNLKNIVELYFVLEQPGYKAFCEAITNQYTYEGFMMAQPLISQISDGMVKVKKITDGMKRFVERLKNTPLQFSSRKLQADHIISSYGETNRADIVFSILDGKEPNKNQLKKLLFQTLVA